MGLDYRRLGFARMYEGYRLKPDHTDQSAAARLIYESENGDRWLLVRTPDAVLVRHCANAPSGGAVTEWDLCRFLTNGNGPEQQALQRLIATLAEAEPKSSLSS